MCKQPAVASFFVKLTAYDDDMSRIAAPTSSTSKGESSQSLLNTHLDEIRALRERLEAAITNNNQLREELEKRLAADESQSADMSSAPVRSKCSSVSSERSVVPSSRRAVEDSCFVFRPCYRYECLLSSAKCHCPVG